MTALRSFGSWENPLGASAAAADSEGCFSQCTVPRDLLSGEECDAVREGSLQVCWYRSVFLLFAVSNGLARDFFSC
jgi:hypothetical protein